MYIGPSAVCCPSSAVCCPSSAVCPCTSAVCCSTATSVHGTSICTATNVHGTTTICTAASACCTTNSACGACCAKEEGHKEEEEQGLLCISCKANFVMAEQVAFLAMAVPKASFPEVSCGSDGLPLSNHIMLPHWFGAVKKC